MNQNFNSARSIAIEQLSSFAKNQDFWQDFDLAFGSDYDQKIALNIKSDLASKSFVFPEIVFVDAQILENADAAFASQNNTIYISEAFLNSHDSEQIAATLIEEIGHSIDAQINPQDSAGDEGQIFSALVRSEVLTPKQLAILKSENDRGSIDIAGEQIATEQAGSIDYGDALEKSILFYKAQRSGYSENAIDGKVDWRKNSALNDGKGLYPNNPNFDLVGGYYDAGDHVKFGFPMASAMTMLGWGAIEYRSAYEQSGQLDEVMNAIKWGTDYIIKANVVVNGETKEFWGQVGDLTLDHAAWVSPENMTMARPASKIDALHPGSDLAGESAAALAAASIIFRPTDPNYARILLDNAKQLYRFAKDSDPNRAGEQQGKYSDSITTVRQNLPNEDAYKSSGYEDELGWSAIWLHKAIKAAGSVDSSYLVGAQKYYSIYRQLTSPDGTWTQTWDDKSYGGMVLMAQELPSISHYRTEVEKWLAEWTTNNTDGSVKYTPGGLAWLNEWGSLRYTANTAFIAGVYADTVNDPNQTYSNFAQSQIEYMLGKKTGFSYMVGFGNKYPERVHHRAASGTSSEGENIDNINDIIGGLVGGPTAPRDDINDSENNSSDPYKDVRDGTIAYKGNEVALDYNAGFTGALARLYGINNRKSISLLKDNFDAENNQTGADNYSSLTNWNVIRGSIDLIGTGYKQDLLENNGLYLDLDGTIIGGGSGGKIESKLNFSFTAGDTVTLKFSLAGSQREDTNDVTVSLGSLFTETFTRDSARPFEQITRSFVVTSPTSGKLIFDHSGGDNLGLLLDNVDLSNTRNGVIGTITRSDFNGDGKSDILWRNTDGNVAIWQLDGATVIKPSVIGSLTSDWTIAGTGDFNGDASADMLLRNTNSNVAIWQTNGSTVTKASTIGTAASDWTIAGTGDFNGDGNSDVLLRNMNGTIATWQTDGSTVTKASVVGSLTPDWTVAGTADFNGDRKADILLRNTNGTVALWEMDGAAVIKGSSVGTLNGWSIAGTADFNGDGNTDILLRNTNGNIAKWQMNGSAVTNASIIGSSTADWKITGTGDFNGDGYADILWRNDGGGVATWQMNGNTVLAAGATSIPSAETSWQIAAPIL